MAEALIAAAPERIMWGTDWPHPNKYVVNPNDGDLVDAFGDWVSDEAMRRRIMVENAGRLLPLLINGSDQHFRNGAANAADPEMLI